MHSLNHNLREEFRASFNQLWKDGCKLNDSEYIGISEDDRKWIDDYFQEINTAERKQLVSIMNNCTDKTQYAIVYNGLKNDANMTLSKIQSDDNKTEDPNLKRIMDTAFRRSLETKMNLMEKWFICAFADSKDIEWIEEYEREHKASSQESNAALNMCITRYASTGGCAVLLIPAIPLLYFFWLNS